MSKGSTPSDYFHQHCPLHPHEVQHNLESEYTLQTQSSLSVTLLCHQHPLISKHQALPRTWTTIGDVIVAIEDIPSSTALLDQGKWYARSLTKRGHTDKNQTEMATNNPKLCSKRPMFCALNKTKKAPKPPHNQGECSASSETSSDFDEDCLQVLLKEHITLNSKPSQTFGLSSTSL